MRYVDVILPLPLDGVFTYLLADEMATKVSIGMRVLVPLGKSKTYTGIVLKIHDEQSGVSGIDYKEVMAVLDEHPVLLWQAFQTKVL